MATRTYKSTTDYDAQQSHWTIETVDDRYYLKMGALNRADQRFIESLIADGFVGFFQNDVRVAIAVVSSTYDAENDRIEIDSEVTELTLEAEYEIRFTQARPGRDGEGAVPTPGRDGERGSLWTSGDAFPEFPHANDHHLFRSDVTTGLTWFDTDGTTALTRAEAADIAEFNGTDWVKKLNIRGIPGIQGIQGSPGEDADDGWSPVFSVIADGERRVLRVSNWVGGTGTKPTTGQYVGISGLVDDIENGVDIRGPRGLQGIQGIPGRDSVGDVQFSYGFFTPQMWKGIWQSATNDQWIAGGPSANGINISSASGRWWRIDTIVHFFMCFRFNVHTTSYPDGVRTIRAFISPAPHGESRISGAHGVGTPMGQNQSGGGWFPVTVQTGDRSSGVSDGLPAENTSNLDSIRVEVIDQDNQGQYFDTLITITGMYTVTS